MTARHALIVLKGVILCQEHYAIDRRFYIAYIIHVQAPSFVRSGRILIEFFK